MNTIKRNFEREGDHISETASRNMTLVDLGHLSEISGGNGSFISAMLQAFKDESSIFLRDMENYLERCDFLAIAKSAHKMKPAGAYIGVNTLTALMSSLEQAATTTNEAVATSLFTEVKKILNKIVSEIDGYVLEHGEVNL